MSTRHSLVAHARMRSKILCGLLAVCLLIARASALELVSRPSVAYQTSIVDRAGVAHDVRFDGNALGDKLNGTLTVDGQPTSLAASIRSDGTVSGRFLNADGTPRGIFWGRRSGTQLKGSFDLGG